MTRRLPALSIVGAVVLAGCVSLTTEASHPLRNRYLAIAAGQLQRCLDARASAGVPVPEPGGATRPRSPNEACGSEAELNVGVAYRRARDEARFERGTTMYLRRYQDAWLGLMRNGSRGGGDAGGATMRMRVEELASIERKLR